jgi:hypothetical protein
MVIKPVPITCECYSSKDEHNSSEDNKRYVLVED